MLIPLAFPLDFCKEGYSVFGCWYPFKAKTASFIIWTHMLLLLMDGAERELSRLDLWPPSTSQHLAFESTPWVPLLSAERDMENRSVSRVVESPWQPVNVGMKCVSHWVAYYRTLVHWEKWANIMNKNFTFNGDLDKKFLILTLL